MRYFLTSRDQQLRTCKHNHPPLACKSHWRSLVQDMPLWPNPSSLQVAIQPDAKGMVPEDLPGFIGLYWGAVSWPCVCEVSSALPRAGVGHTQGELQVEILSRIMPVSFTCMQCKLLHSIEHCCMTMLYRQFGHNLLSNGFHLSFCVLIAKIVGIVACRPPRILLHRDQFLSCLILRL